MLDKGLPDLTKPTEDLDLALFFAIGFIADYTLIAEKIREEIWTRRAIAEGMDQSGLMDSRVLSLSSSDFGSPIGE